MQFNIMFRTEDRRKKRKKIVRVGKSSQEVGVEWRRVDFIAKNSHKKL